MNITFIPTSYLPNVGGVEICTKNLCRQFIDRGHKVNIIANLFPRNLKSHEIIDGVTVDRLPFHLLTPRTLSPIDILRFIYGIFMTPFVVFKLWRLFKKHQTEVVNLQYVWANAGYILSLSYIYRFRLVVTLQGFTMCLLYSLPGKYYWVYPRILRKADYVTACSEALLKDSQKMVPEIKEKSSVIPNGVDIEVFESNDRYCHRRPYIFTLGRFQAKQKGFDILLMSFREILDRGYDIDLVIAGDGFEKELYEHIMDLLKIRDRVKLFGLANRRQVVALFNGCEFFVLPSRFEPFGMVNLEAMAAGKAIVATNVGGVPEIVKDGINGILVEAKDDKALANGMARLLDDSELRDKLGENGRRMTKGYAWKNIADKYLEIFQRKSN